MRSDLLARVNECRAELERLERQVLVVTTRLEAYEDVLSLMPPDGAASVVAPSPMNAATDRRAKRSLSRQWLAALSSLRVSKFSVFTIDNAVEAVAATSGMHPPRGNIRSQLHSYAERGIVERVGQGHFRLTPAGEAELEGFDPDDGVPTADIEETPQSEIALDVVTHPTITDDTVHSPTSDI